MRVATKRAPDGVGAHSSIVGGSTAGLRRKCSASRVEEQGAPNPGSEAADRGTALHYAVEAALNESLGNASVLRQFTGVEHFQDGMSGPVIITEEMLQAKALPALEFFDKHIPETAEFWLEQRVSFTLAKYADAGAGDFEDIEGAYGTADVVFTDPASGRAGVVDWKFGDGHMVAAADNDQMRFYLCAAIMRGFLPVQDVYEATIFQPAASLQPDQYASTGEYTLADLLDFNADLHEAITGPVVHNAGEHCKNCEGKLTCKAFAKLLTTAIETDIEGLDGQRLGELRSMVPAVEAWVKAVKEAAKRNAQAGREVPGWKLEPAEGDREFKDEDAAFNALARLGVPLDVRRTLKTISAPQALDWLRKNGTEAKVIERFERRHIHRPNKGEKLVPAKPGEVTHGALARMSAALAARGL